MYASGQQVYGYDTVVFISQEMVTQTANSSPGSHSQLLQSVN